MSKAFMSSASEHLQMEGYEGLLRKLRPIHCRLRDLHSRRRAPPLFVGLPDDRCQCPHMGYVIKGKLKFAFADGNEELYEAGDAY